MEWKQPDGGQKPRVVEQGSKNQQDSGYRGCEYELGAWRDLAQGATQSATGQHSSPIDGGEKGRGVYPFLYRVHIHISTDAYLSADVKEYRDDP